MSLLAIPFLAQKATITSKKTYPKLPHRAEARVQSFPPQKPQFTIRILVSISI
jgi:hypothetical protein